MSGLCGIRDDHTIRLQCRRTLSGAMALSTSATLSGAVSALRFLRRLSIAYRKHPHCFGKTYEVPAGNDSSSPLTFPSPLEGHSTTVSMLEGRQQGEKLSTNTVWNCQREAQIACRNTSIKYQISSIKYKHTTVMKLTVRAVKKQPSHNSTEIKSFQ